MSEFTWLDWVVAAIVCYSVAMSVVRGFVREALGLGTVIAGVLVAAWFHVRVADVLEGFLRTEGQALFVSFLLLFSCTLLVGFALLRLIRRFFEFAHIQWFDRLLGAAFGLVRGWIVGAVIFLVLTSFSIQSGAVRDSVLSHYFLPAGRFVAIFAPFELKARFLVGYEQIERWWNEGGGREGGEVPLGDVDAEPASQD